MTCVGSVLGCPGCKREYMRRFVAVEFYNELRDLLERNVDELPEAERKMFETIKQRSEAQA